MGLVGAGGEGVVKLDAGIKAGFLGQVQGQGTTEGLGGARGLADKTFRFSQVPYQRMGLWELERTNILLLW